MRILKQICQVTVSLQTGPAAPPIGGDCCQTKGAADSLAPFRSRTARPDTQSIQVSWKGVKWSSFSISQSWEPASTSVAVRSAASWPLPPPTEANWLVLAERDLLKYQLHWLCHRVECGCF